MDLKLIVNLGNVALRYASEIPHYSTTCPVSLIFSVNPNRKIFSMQKSNYRPKSIVQTCVADLGSQKYKYWPVSLSSTQRTES